MTRRSPGRSAASRANARSAVAASNQRQTLPHHSTTMSSAPICGKCARIGRRSDGAGRRGGRRPRPRPAAGGRRRRAARARRGRRAGARAAARPRTGGRRRCAAACGSRRASARSRGGSRGSPSAPRAPPRTGCRGRRRCSVRLSARPAKRYGGTRGTMSASWRRASASSVPAVGGDHADPVAPVVQLARRGDRHVVMAGEHLRHLPAADLRRAHALRDRAVDDEKDPQALVHV